MSPDMFDFQHRVDFARAFRAIEKHEAGHTDFHQRFQITPIQAPLEKAQ
jgi:hypothetical protein